MEISPDIKFVTYDALLDKETFLRFINSQEPIVISKDTAVTLGDSAKFFNIADIYTAPEETLELVRDPDDFEVFCALCYDTYVRPDEVILVCTEKEKEYAEFYFADGMLEVI